METFSGNHNSAEVEKGTAIQNQLRVWEDLVEIRIQLQKLLAESNELPPFEIFEMFRRAAADKDEEGLEFMAAVEKSRRCMKTVMQNFLELQASLSHGNTSDNHDSGQDDEEITSEDDNNEEDSRQNDDEEITSEEEGDNNVEKKSFDESKDRNSDDEDEEGESEDENTSQKGNDLEASIAIDEGNSEEVLTSEADSDGDEDGECVKVKKRRLDKYEQVVAKSFKASIPRRNEIIQKWNDKTQIASGKPNKNNFSAFQISTLKQIDLVMANKQRLLKRTQARNSHPANKKGKDDEDVEDTVDPEYFNDDDFFHQLLRELIENSASNTEKSDLSRHYLKLQKLRTKSKRKIDTKASKGRKIRYDVHPKLVNFMAAYTDKNSMSENAKTELYKSIFKKLNEWQNELE